MEFSSAIILCCWVINGIVVLGQEESDCEIGTHSSSLLDSSFPTAITGMYLDILHPATCNGRLSALSLCYPATLTQGDELATMLQVWRQSEQEQDSLHLRMVREIELTVTVSSELVPSFSLVCAQHSLVSGHIDLMQGDILGVILPSQPDSEFLPVVTNSTESGGLFQVVRESTDAEMPLSESDLVFVSSLSLEVRMVYAGVASSQPTPTDVISHIPSNVSNILGSTFRLALEPLPSLPVHPTPSNTQPSVAPSNRPSVHPSDILQENRHTTILQSGMLKTMLPTILPSPVHDGILVGTDLFTSSLPDHTTTTQISKREETPLSNSVFFNSMISSSSSNVLAGTEKPAATSSSGGMDFRETSMFGLTPTPVQNMPALSLPPESATGYMTVSADFLTANPSPPPSTTPLIYTEFGSGESEVLSPSQTSGASSFVSSFFKSKYPPTLTALQPTLHPMQTDLASHPNSLSVTITPSIFPASAPMGTPLLTVTSRMPYSASHSPLPEPTDTFYHSTAIRATRYTNMDLSTLLNTATDLIASTGPAQTKSDELAPTPSALCPQPCPSSQSQDTGTFTQTQASPLPSSSPSQPIYTHTSQDSLPLPSSTPTINQPDGKLLSLTHSFIAVTVVVCVLFCILSGCVMLTCTYVAHCRKAPKVDQLASRRRSVLEIDNPSYFVKQSDESACPVHSELTTNQLNTSLESNKDGNDNVTWNSSFTARNCSQASRRLSKGSQHRHDLEMGVVGEIELEAPTSNGQNEVIESSCAVEVVVVRDIQEGTPESRHEYEELELENLITMPTPTRGLSTLRREHDYEDPDVEPSDSKEPVAKSTKAHEYEEPINNAWKRLSMPALNISLPTHNVPRRNSTASELFRSTGIESKKPAKIFHYAEFSLYPSQNTSGVTPQPHLSASPHCKLPREPNQYEEPSCTAADRHHPLCLGPIPAPTRLLRSASDYEVPLMINATKKGNQSIKIRPPQSVMRQVKLTLERLSQSMNGNSKDDEEAEKLIDGESDTTPDQLKSPESCILSESGSCRSQEDNEGNFSQEQESISPTKSMDGAYFFPSPVEGELQSVLKKLSIEIIPQSSIESTLTNEQVQHGVWRKDESGTKVDVTLKVIGLPSPSGETDEDYESSRAKLLQEVVIMRQFRHPNIPRLYGVIDEDRHTTLVSEHFPRGDLRKILVQMGRSVIPSDAPELLLTYSQQVALGMQYLASKGFVHRDLCARNVFVSSQDICKVGGFEKSRDLTDVNDYITKGGRVQVRWTAPEAMYYRQYSTASDVWSYGCLLYEIWSLGRMPFRDYTNAEVIEKIDSGYRLPPPPGCPRVIYDLMIQCWNPNPFSRPCFKDVINILLQDEDRMLQIPIRDASTHESAIILGANLKTGAYMYADLQQRYVRQMAAAGNGRLCPHDYDHIEEEQYMFTFPTSSADLAHGTKSKREAAGSRCGEREGEEGLGCVSLVPQPSLYYSIPVECDRSPPLAFTISRKAPTSLNCADYEDIID